jgi:hypothetical protein
MENIRPSEARSDDVCGSFSAITLLACRMAHATSVGTREGWRRGLFSKLWAGGIILPTETRYNVCRYEE